MVIDLDSVPYYPAKNQRLVRRLGGASGTKPDHPRVISIHTIEGPRAVGAAVVNATWQRESGAYGGEVVSSHAVVDPATVLRCVQDDAVAFTQGTPWNDMCLSLEQAGRASQTAEEWADDLGAPQVELDAQVCAFWCVKWGIPARFVEAAELARSWQTVSGITTHYQITLASQSPLMKALGYKSGSHTDPGQGFPMLSMIERVKAIIAGPHTPEDDDVPTEIKLVAADHTTLVWNPPTNTLRWVNDGNVDALEPASAFLAVFDGSAGATLPNGNSVDDGIRSLISNTVKAGRAPGSGSFANAW